MEEKNIRGKKGFPLFSVMDRLLKSPAQVVSEIRNSKKSGLNIIMLFIILLCMVIYGFINGLFSGGAQLLAAPVKFAAGLLLSGLICLPSFYIFLALSGANIAFKDTLGVLLAALAVSAVLLTGFGPILWIFSQTTNSPVFIGVLNLLFWIIASSLGLRVLFKSIELLAEKKRNFVIVWIILFNLVALQMTTTLRPMIGPSDKLINLEKKFFLNYWGECIEAGQKSQN